MPRLCGPWFAVAALICTAGLLRSVEQPTAEPQADAKQEHASRIDLYGDPLPPGAIARLGTVRWRHSSSVMTLAFSPDGKTIATGGADLTIRVWELATGKELLRLQVSEGRHAPSPHCVAFSGDGTALAATWGRGSKQGLGVWDAATGKEFFKLHFSLAAETIESIAFSPDGTTLATGRADKSIRFWNARTGREKGELHGHDEFITSVVYSPDGKLLASAGADGTLRLWDVDTGKELAAFRGHNGGVATVAFSPDGRTLVSGGSDKTIRLWATATGKEFRTLQGHNDVIKSLVFYGDGKFLASSSRDYTIRLWNVTSGAEIRKLDCPADQVAISRDGKTLATGGDTAHYCVRLWDVVTGEEIVREQGHRRMFFSLAFSSDGKTLVSQSNGSIRSWELGTGKQLHVLRTDGYLNRFALAPDGHTMAFAERWNDTAVRIYDSVTGKEFRRLPGHESGVWSLAFSPDGRIMASGGFSERDQHGSVHLWGMVTGRKLHDLKGHKHYVTDLVFSPDGKMLASGSDAARLWDVATGMQLLHFPVEMIGVWSVTFSPDGKTLAFVDQRGVLRLWEVETRKEILSVPVNNYWGLAFSADGRTLASGFAGGIIRLWDIPTAKRLLDLHGHQARIRALAFSPDGKTLASGSDDTTVLIWDVAATLNRDSPSASEYKELNLADLWTDLGSEDAARAHKALWALVALREKAVTWIRDRLRPVKEAEYKSIERLITELDSKDFSVREGASKELENLGIQAVPKLHLVLQGQPSLELRRRVEVLLDNLQQPRPRPEDLRSVRGIRVLEQTGSPEAWQILETLAQGAAQAQRTRDAKAALDRLDRRRKQ